MKKALIIYIFFTGLITFHTLEMNGQENTYDFYKEKVYLSLPKILHVAGEKMEYATYLLDEHENNLMRSKIVYYALISKNNQQVLHWWDRINTILTPGAIVLPDTLSEGEYTLLAYTNWMRNRPDESIFSTRVYIAKLSDETIPELESNSVGSQEAGLIITAEGGKLVKDIKNRLIFYYSDDREFTDSTIVILSSQNGDTAARKKLSRGKFGKLDFIPDEEHYSLTLISGKTRERKKLPPVQDYGYSMVAAINSNNSARVNLHTNMPAFSGNRLGKLVIIQDKQEYYSKEVHFKEDSLTVFIPENTIRPGVSNLVLEVNSEPVIDRLIYGFSHQENKLSLSLSKKKYQTREKTSIEITANELNESDTIICSVSVEKKMAPLVHEKPTMVTSLKPSSGIAFFPHYLNDGNINIYLATCKAPYPGQENNEVDISYEFIPEIKDYVITGKLKNTRDGTPLPGCKVFLTFKDSTANLDYAITNEQGQFLFQVNKRYDNKLLILMLETDSLNARWEIDKKYFLPKESSTKNTVILTPENVNTIKEYKKNYLIGNIYQQEYNNDDNHQSVSIPGYRRTTYQISPEEVIFPGDFYSLKNFEEITRNILPGVKFSEKDGIPYIRIFNMERQSFWENHPIIFLNGIPFNDLRYIATLGTKEIKKISINRKCVFYGNLSFYGVLSIITHDGFIPREYIDQHQKINHEKLSIHLENHESKIDEGLAGNPNFPLLNSLLLWNPEVMLQGKEKRKLEFFTSDIPGVYTVTVEGIISGKVPFHLKKDLIVE